MYSYNLQGKRISLKEAADLQQSKLDNYFRNRVFSSKSTNVNSHKYAHTQMNSPWDYELQRFLIQGGRQLTISKKMLNKPKRLVQSAGSRLLQEYEIKEADDDDERKSNISDNVHRYVDNDEFLNIEFNAEDDFTDQCIDHINMRNPPDIINDMFQKFAMNNKDTDNKQTDAEHHFNPMGEKNMDDSRSSPSSFSSFTSSRTSLIHSDLHAKMLTSSSSTTSLSSSLSSDSSHLSNENLD
ncbi:unnamed protein product, partial [Schistosoma turkestanicum]